MSVIQYRIRGISGNLVRTYFFAASQQSKSGIERSPLPPRSSDYSLYFVLGSPVFYYLKERIFSAIAPKEKIPQITKALKTAFPRQAHAKIDLIKIIEANNQH